MHVSLPGLAEVRAGIDQVDLQILELIHRRLELVLKVGEIKREHGAPIFDPERERRVLERLANACQPPVPPELARRVFECLIEQSRRVEQDHVSAAAASGK